MMYSTLSFSGSIFKSFKIVEMIKKSQHPPDKNNFLSILYLPLLLYLLDKILIKVYTYLYRTNSIVNRIAKMDTDKQKLKKLQAKLVKIEKQTEELRKTVNIVTSDTEWKYVPGFCEYFLHNIEKILLNLEKIVKK